MYILRLGPDLTKGLIVHTISSLSSAANSVYLQLGPAAIHWLLLLVHTYFLTTAVSFYSEKFPTWLGIGLDDRGSV